MRWTVLTDFGSSTQSICHLYTRKGETEANANLMAAAPEMLEALEAVKALIEVGILVRDTSSDGNYSEFLKQGMEVTRTITLIQQSIEKATS